jgi:membrane protease YdiL (CAAX protease family)
MKVNRTDTTPLETIGIVLLCFGYFVLVSVYYMTSGDAGLIRMSDAALIQTLVFELIMAAVATLVLYSRGFAIGTLYPRPSWSGAGIGGLLVFATYAVSFMLIHIVSTGDADQPIAMMLRNAQVSPAVAMLMSMVNGCYEEVFLLGFLIQGLKRHGASQAVGMSLLVRLLYHVYQGPLGSLSVLMFGAIVSVYYWRSRRLFPAVFAHIVLDMLALSLG